MSKIPVGDTISRTYGFTFSNILSIFGIAWLPNVVLVAIAIGLVVLLAPELPGMLLRGQFDPFLAMHAMRAFGLLGILSFIVTCMVIAGIQRKALGRHPDPVFVYFSLGAPVWRMAGSLFLAGLVIFFVAIVTIAAGGAIWFLAGHYAANYALPIRVVAIVTACLWLIYLVVRLTFFLPAVVVAEERIGLGRAWELADGNFWRIFIVAIAIFLPVLIGFAIVSGAILGPMVVIPHWHAGMDPSDFVKEMFRRSIVLSPVALAIRVVERIVFLGLANGAIANSYLAVTGSPAGAAPAAAPTPPA